MEANQLGDEPIELQNTWVLWYVDDGYKPPTAQSPEAYAANLKIICSFKTVQNFWCCFNNMPQPETIKHRSSWHIMVEGVKPIWEDPKK
eukprot:TRINITY_DN8732_c0_g1_i1.p1 TRINITY_DN8732_c0_g1~~TRINITY_DN8732_c0_g1_i1.p1  ORF type:complete len:104 (+),score=24.41 TRINITY_DN8732_c0_g1_i1:46-312(+)